MDGFPFGSFKATERLPSKEDIPKWLRKEVIPIISRSVSATTRFLGSLPLLRHILLQRMQGQLQEA